MLLDFASKVVDYSIEQGARFSDVRIILSRSTNVSIIDGNVRSVSNGISEGFGIRVLVGNAWGYGYSSKIEKDSCLEATRKALSMAKAQASRVKDDVVLAYVKAREEERILKVKINPRDVDVKKKVDASLELERATRIDDRIVNSNALYRDQDVKVYFASSDGLKLSWNEVRTSIACFVVAFEAGRGQSWYNILDGFSGFELVEKTDLQELGRKTAFETVKMLNAKAPPTGILDST